MSEAPVAETGRIDAIDVARALALLGMVAYHLSWDLAYFGLAPPELPFTPAMRVLANIVASTFLGLIGVSLAIAHRDRLHWRPFYIRLGRIVAAAALVSAATAFMARDMPIWFGILHCIAVSSVISLAFLRAPPVFALLAGAVAILAPHLVASPLFDPAPLLWLGLGMREPSTLDWRPLFPWLGAALIGLGLTRLTLSRFLNSRIARWRAEIGPARALAFVGRHSLAFYLMHQPIMFGLLYVLAFSSGAATRQERASYMTACTPACVEKGGEIEACRRACECVADGADRAGIFESLRSPDLSAHDREQLAAIVQSCSSD